MKENKLVCGVGINDADYTVQKKRCWTVDGKRHFEVIWTCPFYEKWLSMHHRCYNQKYHDRRPNYLECYVIPEWHYFTAFRAWMVKQDWENKHLDKDLLIPGNRIYGPETCVFVDLSVNSFLLENSAKRGNLPIGVTFDKNKQKYVARIKDSYTGGTRVKTIGYYTDPITAHFAWLEYKKNLARILASRQTDQRVAEALVDRYENYHLYFGGVPSLV